MGVTPNNKAEVAAHGLSALRFARGWQSDHRRWVAACCRPVADWQPRLEILCLDLGLLLSLYTGCRISLTHSTRLAHALRALAPWALLMALLFVAGVWLVLQPMEMRGTMPG